LCDNQSLLKAVNRWIGEGGKATLVGAPDADILATAIEILRKRIAAGTATFLVKVRAHRGEPASRHSGGKGYFRSEGRQRVMPTDESSNLHVVKTVPQGRESNSLRSSFDI